MSAQDHRPASAPWGAYGERNLSEDGFRCRPLTERVIDPFGIVPAQKAFQLVMRSAPSRIRTCAHGSGGRLCDLANLCLLPARTQSLVPGAVLIIPRIFRIMAVHGYRPSAGRTYPQLAQIVRASSAVAGRRCQRLAAAVAVTVAVSWWPWSRSPDATDLMALGAVY